MQGRSRFAKVYLDGMSHVLVYEVDEGRDAATVLSDQVRNGGLIWVSALDAFIPSRRVYQVERLPFKRCTKGRVWAGDNITCNDTYPVGSECPNPNHLP